ncbi:MAG: hypothetical protein QOE75_116 [Solirubrobacterales bacterium]|jgi:hypothetical protein|nr:hypothetical protein [Solirubrobacterales bacterium]
MRRLLLPLVAALCLGALLAAPAQGAFGLKELDTEIVAQGGAPGIPAGQHPLSVTTALATITEPEHPILGYEYPEGALKDLRVVAPAGLVGNPTAVPQCSSADFLAKVGIGDCPNASALGIVSTTISEPEVNPFTTLTAPVYNLTPPPGVAARIGFWTLIVPLTIDFRVNPDSPHNVIVEVNGVPQVTPLYRSTVTLWGVPADPIHDPERGTCAGKTEVSCPVSVPVKPFITLPSSCEGPLTFGFEAESWEGDTFTAPVTAHDGSLPPETTPSGCSKLSFSPSVSAQATSKSATSSTGLDFAIGFDDKGLTSPTGTAQSTIREATVKMPAGFTLNPSAANGLQACSVAAYESETAFSAPGAGCPAASKVADVEVETPLLEGRLLRGQVYVAEQGTNLLASRYVIYMVIKDPDLGISVKLPGRVEPDPATGQLTTVFGQGKYPVPQFPFSQFRFHFKQGARAPLVTPPACGTYTGQAVLRPWSGGESRTLPIPLEVNSGIGGAPCPPPGAPPFEPTLEAGTTDNAAGTYSPLSLRITVPEGGQQLTRIDSVLPPGLTGKVAGIPLCADAALAAAATKTGRAELAAPSCPAASRLGSVTAGAGVGDTLTYVGGTIYLAGPFGGDPLSIAVITPAVAGPFDVGTVVIREGLNLDPTTGEAQVDGSSSAPIPQILEGIPLRLRDLRVSIDRPEFTLNATSCEPLSLRATLFGSGGSVAARSTRYQASSCASLLFKPKLNISLKGGTKRAQHTALKAVLTPRKGDANVGSSVVVLPRSQQIDNAHVENPCTRDQFAAEACPRGSILGTAKAVSPLLDAPLEGLVYFRSNGGARLIPDVVVDLRGQFRIVLVGFVDTITPNTNPRLRTRFLTVPDAPVSKFTLSLYGGKRGLLVNNRNLCRSKQVAELRLSGQNGRQHNTKPVLATSCKKPKG